MKRALVLTCAVLAIGTRVLAGQDCAGGVCVVSTVVSVRVEPRLRLAIAATGTAPTAFVRANSGWSMQVGDTPARTSATIGGPTDGVPVLLLAFQTVSVPGQLPTVRITLATR